jgi:hypothetical protein
MADATKTVNEYGLLAEDIIAHTRIVQSAESAIKTYFHRHSKLMRAIHKHIGNPNAECFIIDRPPNPICRYSECGAAVHFKDLTVYGVQFDKDNKPYMPEDFQLTIEVEYEDEDTYNDTCTRSYWISVPIDLEVNFTQEKFNAWVNGLAQKRKDEREAKDKEAMQTLLKKYPQWGNSLNPGT